MITKGYFGNCDHPCEIISHDGYYVVKGHKTVNHTYDEIKLGTSVEQLHDTDCFTWSEPINTEEELIEAING